MCQSKLVKVYTISKIYTYEHTWWYIVDVEVSRYDGKGRFFTRLFVSFPEDVKLGLNFGHGPTYEILLALVGHHVKVGHVPDFLIAILL